jgi:hypothetical protein
MTERARVLLGWLLFPVTSLALVVWGFGVGLEAVGRKFFGWCHIVGRAPACDCTECEVRKKRKGEGIDGEDESNEEAG